MGSLASITKNLILKSIENREYSIADGLPYWREKIFNILLLSLMVFGSLAIIPNLIASTKNGTTLITITDSIAYFSIVFLYFFQKIKLFIKVIVVIAAIYVLSLVLLIILGPYGPGLVWLSSTSILAAFLLGRKATFLSIAFNALIIIGLIILIKSEIFNTVYFSTYTPLTWFAVSLNVIIFNAISALPVAFLIENLEKVIKNETELKKELTTSNDQLKLEIEHAMESDKLKSAFLANLSHEIRTPMNAIIGFSELIQMEDDKSATLEKYTQYIIQNSLYLQNIINDIVDISLIESGQIRLIYEVTTLNEVYIELFQLIETNPIRKRRENVDVTFNCTNELKNKEIYIDKNHLKQILINLIINSLKYTNNGSVALTCKSINEKIEFCVADTGIGIPENEQCKVFNRFTKIERNNHHLVPGLGIGLSIIKGLVEAMKGEIWFTSVENKGSKFYFTIPFKQSNL